MRIVGNGGLARQIQDVIDSFNCYSISTHGRVSNSDAVIIGFASLDDISKRAVAFEREKMRWGKLGTLLSPKATVSQDARIGEGCVILHDAFVGPWVKLDENVLVATRAIVEHNSIIGSHSVVLTGAIINGECEIGQCCMIGSGAILIQGIKVCNNVTIGAGTVVIENITEPGTYVGHPARRVK